MKRSLLHSGWVIILIIPIVVLLSAYNVYLPIVLSQPTPTLVPTRTLSPTITNTPVISNTTTPLPTQITLPPGVYILGNNTAIVNQFGLLSIFG